MKYFKNTFIGVCILLNILAIQKDSKIFCEENFEKIILNIDVEKSDFILGEPVKIKILLTNKMDVPLKYYNAYLDPANDLLKILISKDNKIFKQYYGGWGMRDVYYQTVNLLQPGNVAVKELQIIYNARTNKTNCIEEGYVFSECGKYYIKAVLNIFRTLLESQTVVIDINEPTGINATVWALIKEKEFAKFLSDGSINTKREIIETCMDVLKHYRDSIYTPYIKEALIKYYRTKPDKTPEEKEYLKTLQKD
jgi:hypothetical protein